MGKKFIDFPGGQVKTQTQRPSRALNLDMCVASGTAERQRYCHLWQTGWLLKKRLMPSIDPKTNRRPTPTLSAPQSVYEYSAPKSHAKSTLPRQTLSTLSTFNSRKKIIGKIPAVRRKKRLDITYWLISFNLNTSI